MAIRVLIADDHPLIREGLVALLSRHADIEVVGAVADGREAVSRVAEHEPHVVVMDIEMPGLNGIEAAGRIAAERPATRVLMLSMFDTAEHVYRAMRAGASGYLLKESAGAEVVEAIRVLRSGGRYLSRRIGSLASVEERLAREEGPGPVESLSRREREILQLVVEGRSSAEIARALHLSPKTVDTYRSRLMQKLGVPDITALVRFALRHGLG